MEPKGVSRPGMNKQTRGWVARIITAQGSCTQYFLPGESFSVFLLSAMENFKGSQNA